MCGRYHFGIPDTGKGRKIKERARKIGLTYKTGEIFPSDKVLCIVPIGSSLDLAVKKWGIQGRFFQINARIESIGESRTYRDMKDRRCAVLCDGFYEWDKEKNRYFITCGEELMYLACIYNGDDELLIITKEADERFRDIHERMPIVMDEEEMKAYIHNEDPLIKDKVPVITREEYEMKLF